MNAFIILAGALLAALFWYKPKSSPVVPDHKILPDLSSPTIPDIGMDSSADLEDLFTRPAPSTKYTPQIINNLPQDVKDALATDPDFYEGNGLSKAEAATMVQVVKSDTSFVNAVNQIESEDPSASFNLGSNKDYMVAAAERELAVLRQLLATQTASLLALYPDYFVVSPTQQASYRQWSGYDLQHTMEVISAAEAGLAAAKAGNAYWSFDGTGNSVKPL